VREAYVRSHTALDIFGLEGQDPESRLKDEPVDISKIADYEWYECSMVYLPVYLFPRFHWEGIWVLILILVLPWPFNGPHNHKGKLSSNVSHIYEIPYP
jgi:hypothetical protein